MCGIAGIFNLNGERVDRELLHKMDEVLKHRGPDGHGEIIEENIGLANRRLAIIDPTAKGQQPMSSIDGNYWITFNGEIFNYLTLRDDLINKGFRFKSHSDTETILYGFIHYGKLFVKKLIGQFAFCIWDKKNKLFFLARDHLGVNPLFYITIENQFIFASEVKAILKSGMVKREIDREALHHYLSIFCIPSPLTIIKGVKSLLPGHIMTVSHQNIKIEKYWDIPVGLWRGKKVQPEQLQEQLEELLKSSVEYARVSDVPVGAFLSGGIDSSLVVALLAGNSNTHIKTFSLWAEGEAFDERKYAREVAHMYATDHTEFTISEKEVVEELPKMVYYFDQPTGGSFETYFISKLASQEVKVALSGLGGDELFAGYHEIVHKTKQLASLYRIIPPSWRLSVTKFFAHVLPKEDLKKTVKVANYFLSLPDSIKQRLFLYFAFTEEEKKKIYAKDFLESAKPQGTNELFERLLDNVREQHDVDKLSYLDLKTYTRDDLLLGTNMMSMANSLEARVPLLDPRLVEFAATIPPDLKYRNGITKYILKKVAQNLLPKKVIEHKKTGFGFPRVKVMKGKLRLLIESTLSKESIKKRGIFSSSYVSKELEKFFQSNNQKMLWSEHLRVWLLFIFELWARQYLDRT